MPLINKEAMDSESVSACPNNGNKQMKIKYFFIYLNKNTLITSWLGLTECIKNVIPRLSYTSFLKNSVHILIVTSEKISTYLLQLVRAPHAPMLFIRDNSYVSFLPLTVHGTLYPCEEYRDSSYITQCPHLSSLTSKWLFSSLVIATIVLLR